MKENWWNVLYFTFFLYYPTLTYFFWHFLKLTSIWDVYLFALKSILGTALTQLLDWDKVMQCRAGQIQNTWSRRFKRDPKLTGRCHQILNIITHKSLNTRSISFISNLFIDTIKSNITNISVRYISWDQDYILLQLSII